MAKIPILFNHYGDEWMRGSEVLLLDLLSGLDKSRFIPIVWCNGREMAAACEAAGYCTYQSQFRTMFDYGSGPPNPRRYFATIRRGAHICRDHKIRVIHANSAAPAQWLVPISRTMRLPMLTHLHISYLKRSRYAFLLHGSNKLVGVSRQVLDGPKSDGIIADRLQIIYNGINFERLHRNSGGFRRKNGIPDYAILITTAGSLIKRKGHDLLLQAFQATLEDNPEVHLAIMGEGPEEAVLREMSSSMGITKRVHFLGHVDDVSAVYSESDIFALASRNDSFGLVLAEAGYFGLPSVSTNVGGIPEVVENNLTGLLVEPENVLAFSDALSMLIRNSALRRDLGNAAKARIEALFSSETMVTQFEKLYCELAALPKDRLGWGDLSSQVWKPFMSLMFCKTLYRDRDGQ